MQKQNNNAEKGLIFRENKPLVITVCVVAAIIILIFAIFMLTKILSGIEKEPPITPIEGEYSISMDVGQSSYVFKKDGSGTNSYITEGEPVTREFSYVITGSGDSKTITFTWKDDSTVTTHSYKSGYTTKPDSEEKQEFIMINGEIYYKE